MADLSSELLLDLSKFFELTADLMCVLSADGHCLKVNPAFERVLGYSEQDVEGQCLSALTHPGDRLVNQSRLERFLTDRATAGKTNARMTFRHVKPESAADASNQGSQRVIWIEWRFAAMPSDSTLYCTGRNITRRIEQLSKAQGRYSSLLKTRNHGQVETAIAKQEVKLYMQAIHNIPTGLFILRLDDPDDPNSIRIIFSNPAASDCTGVAVELSLGDRLVDIFPNLKETNIPETYAKVIRHSQPVDLGEIVYGDERVTKSVFEVKAFPLMANYAGVAFENITERKRREEDLLTANILLTETMALLEHRNQELDQFAYVASHDLKAPLRAIANLATWIEEDIGALLPPENKDQFDLLKSRVSRMEGLINGLLAYSRVGRISPHSEQVDVQKMLTGIVGSLLPKDEFTVEIGPNMPTIRTQKILLSQVFLNLISNAIDHHNRSDGHIEVSVQSLKDAYEFTISDDGPGIEADYHDKIFAIFQTLKARDDFESTGIGLSIVRKILTEVGGSISIESALGEGTTFRFTWPKNC